MRAILGSTFLLLATPAAAQGLTGGVEAATDESRRGLSWTEGRATASADLLVPLGPVEASARVVALRGADRHAGADAVADLELGLVNDIGPVRLRAHVTGHVFTGAREAVNYVELGASGSFTLGPLQATALAVYAPDQSAIGGSNLYLQAGAVAGVPATPLTLFASLGRTSGDTDDPRRAARLRPAGGYHDWRLGVEWNRFPFTLGLEYVGTDVDGRTSLSPFADLRHSGDRLIGRARLSF